MKFPKNVRCQRVKRFIDFLKTLNTIYNMKMKISQRYCIFLHTFSTLLRVEATND